MGSVRKADVTGLRARRKWAGPRVPSERNVQPAFAMLRRAFWQSRPGRKDAHDLCYSGLFSHAMADSSLPRVQTRLPALDGLRGIAIWMVLLGHYFVEYCASDLKRSSHLLSTVSSRYLWGVDLFFVISGFLIGGILLEHRHSPAMIKAFYRRRTLRIWPLYFFLVLLLAGPTYFLGFAAQERYVPYWSYLLFVQNIPMSTGYWALLPFAPLWSVAIEEQFYVAAPLLVRKASIGKIKSLILVTIALAIAMRMVCLSVTWLTDIFSLCRMDAIALGILGALIVRKEAFSTLFTPGRLRVFFVLMLPGFFVIAAFSPLPAYFAALAPSYVAVFFLALLLLALQTSSAVAGRVLKHPLLVASGKYCYFLYLFHLTVLYNVELVFEDNPVAARVVSLGVCFALAFISWRFIESPLIAIGHRWAYSEHPKTIYRAGELAT